MNLYKKTIYALSIAALAGMTSCSQQEDLLPGEMLQGERIPLSITVARGGDATRTAIRPDDKGGLTSVWTYGDVLAIYDSKGEKVGELTLKEGEENKSTSIFEGEFTTTGESGDYALWYFGKPADGDYSYLTFKKSAGENVVYIDLIKQNFYSPADLAARDVMSKKVTLKVDGNRAEVTEDVTMNALFAMAHFTLTGIDENVKGKLTVSDADGKAIKVQGYGNLRTSGMGTQTLQGTDITVENAGKDVYMAFATSAGTNNNGQSYKLAFKFEAENGDVYTYAFENASTLYGGKYYNNITVNLEKEASEEILDHSKNPLAMWAESDLKRTNSSANTSASAAAGAKGEFTGDYKITGSYYQFGRNNAYSSYSEVNTNYNRILVAKINNNWTGGQFNTSLYGVVNGSNLSNVYNGSGKAQTAKWYTSNMNLASYPHYFLVAGNSKIQNWNGEYVFNTSKRHAQKWAERAKDMGYSNETPCPEGWRLPTIDDWKRILPKGGHVYSTKATDNFDTFSEIKEDGDIKYAIRWSRVTEGSTTKPTQYLKIEALVVPSTTTSTDNVDWTDANVVTRYFKGAGMIRPFFYLARLISEIGTSYQWLEKAMPEGFIDSNTLNTGGTTGAVKVDLLRDDSWIGGYYWVDDANHYYMNFRFDPDNLQEQGSFIQVLQPEVPIACNIRCIKK